MSSNQPRYFNGRRKASLQFIEHETASWSTRFSSFFRCPAKLSLALSVPIFEGIPKSSEIQNSASSTNNDLGLLSALAENSSSSVTSHRRINIKSAEDLLSDFIAQPVTANQSVRHHLESLLKKRPDLVNNESFATTFMTALQKRNIPVVEFFLDAQPKFATTMQPGNITVYHALADGPYKSGQRFKFKDFQRIMNKLIEASGHTVEQPDYKGRRPVDIIRSKVMEGENYFVYRLFRKSPAQQPQTLDQFSSRVMHDDHYFRFGPPLQYLSDSGRFSLEKGRAHSYDHRRKPTDRYGDPNTVYPKSRDEKNIKKDIPSVGSQPPAIPNNNAQDPNVEQDRPKGRNSDQQAARPNSEAEAANKKDVQPKNDSVIDIASSRNKKGQMPKKVIGVKASGLDDPQDGGSPVLRQDVDGGKGDNDGQSIADEHGRSLAAVVPVPDSQPKPPPIIQDKKVAAMDVVRDSDGRATSDANREPKNPATGDVALSRNKLNQPSNEVNGVAVGGRKGHQEGGSPVLRQSVNRGGRNVDGQPLADSNGGHVAAPSIARHPQHSPRDATNHSVDLAENDGNRQPKNPATGDVALSRNKMDQPSNEVNDVAVGCRKGQQNGGLPVPSQAASERGRDGDNQLVTDGHGKRQPAAKSALNGEQRICIEGRLPTYPVSRSTQTDNHKDLTYHQQTKGLSSSKEHGMASPSTVSTSQDEFPIVSAHVRPDHPMSNTFLKTPSGNRDSMENAFSLAAPSHSPTAGQPNTYNTSISFPQVQQRRELYKITPRNERDCWTPKYKKINYYRPLIPGLYDSSSRLTVRTSSSSDKIGYSTSYNARPQGHHGQDDVVSLPSPSELLSVPRNTPEHSIVAEGLSDSGTTSNRAIPRQPSRGTQNLGLGQPPNLNRKVIDEAQSMNWPPVTTRSPQSGHIGSRAQRTDDETADTCVKPRVFDSSGNHFQRKDSTTEALGVFDTSSSVSTKQLQDQLSAIMNPSGKFKSQRKSKHPTGSGDGFPPTSHGNSATSADLKRRRRRRRIDRERGSSLLVPEKVKYSTRTNSLGTSSYLTVSPKTESSLAFSAGTGRSSEIGASDRTCDSPRRPSSFHECIKSDGAVAPDLLKGDSCSPKRSVHLQSLASGSCGNHSPKIHTTPAVSLSGSFASELSTGKASALLPNDIIKPTNEVFTAKFSDMRLSNLAVNTPADKKQASVTSLPVCRSPSNLTSQLPAAIQSSKEVPAAEVPKLTSSRNGSPYDMLLTRTQNLTPSLSNHQSPFQDSAQHNNQRSIESLGEKGSSTDCQRQHPGHPTAVLIHGRSGFLPSGSMLPQNTTEYTTVAKEFQEDDASSNHRISQQRPRGEHHDGFLQWPYRHQKSVEERKCTRVSSLDRKNQHSFPKRSIVQNNMDKKDGSFIRSTSADSRSSSIQPNNSSKRGQRSSDTARSTSSKRQRGRSCLRSSSSGELGNRLNSMLPIGDSHSSFPALHDGREISIKPRTDGVQSFPVLIPATVKYSAEDSSPRAPSSLSLLPKSSYRPTLSPRTSSSLAPLAGTGRNRQLQENDQFDGLPRSTGSFHEFGNSGSVSAPGLSNGGSCSPRRLVHSESLVFGSPGRHSPNLHIAPAGSSNSSFSSQLSTRRTSSVLQMDGITPTSRRYAEKTRGIRLTTLAPVKSNTWKNNMRPKSLGVALNIPNMLVDKQGRSPTANQISNEPSTTTSQLTVAQAGKQILPAKEVSETGSAKRVLPISSGLIQPHTNAVINHLWPLPGLHDLARYKDRSARKPAQDDYYSRLQPKNAKKTPVLRRVVHKDPDIGKSLTAMLAQNPNTKNVVEGGGRRPTYRRHPLIGAFYYNDDRER